MPCRFPKSLMLAGLVISHASASANSLDNIRFVTGLSLGYSEFSFPEKLDHDVGFASVSIPLIVTSDRWQLSTNLQTNLADANISEEEDIGEASRNDLDITLGYQVSNSWTVYAGYKYGETEIDFVPRDIDDEEQDSSGLTQSTDTYKQNGPFIGVSYAWRFENAGSLSVSMAYAQLSSENDFSANTDEEEDGEEAAEFDDLTGRIDGDTKGFSYSVNWTMPVSSNLLFQARFKINDYKQDVDFDGNRFNDIDESFSTLHVGLAYVF